MSGPGLGGSVTKQILIFEGGYLLKMVQKNLRSVTSAAGLRSRGEDCGVVTLLAGWTGLLGLLVFTCLGQGCSLHGWEFSRHSTA